MLIQANALHIPLAAESVHCVVTSPPYWGLRRYSGQQDFPWPAVEYAPLPGLPSLRVDAREGGLGLEPSIEAYIGHMVAIFRELWRVLRKDGTVWVNMGDSYAANRPGGQPPPTNTGNRAGYLSSDIQGIMAVSPGLKPKDLCGIPWRLALALQADGWWLRSDVIWCLSGGAWLYTHTQKGDMPMMVKDVARLDPTTVRLWNGTKWTQLLGMSRSARRGNEVEIVLRLGERVSCTPSHSFPTQRGLIKADSLQIGDVLQSCQLPEPDNPRDCAIDNDAAWFAGLYLAEGSRAGNTIQITGHIKEIERWKRVQYIAAKFGGSATKTEAGNVQHIRVYGKVLNAIIGELVSGRVAKDKGFAPHVWQYSNRFIGAMLDGYLSGDGHYDKRNDRWRLGFTRNYNLERDLRTACARLGYSLTLNLSTSMCGRKAFPSFRGEIRKTRSGHSNEKDRGEIVEIRKARCRYVYDLGVADDPHLFALASGILTHNSKPNPMPESVTDRPTKAHEYVFLLSKSGRYFWDQEAVKEKSVKGDAGAGARNYVPDNTGGARLRLSQTESARASGRNIRSVWTIATVPYKKSHFATFAPGLVEPCVKAGTSARGCCPECGAFWERVVERVAAKSTDCPKTHASYRARGGMGQKKTGTVGRSGGGRIEGYTTTIGWQSTCSCPEQAPIPCTVLDPFCGSGTTGMVAKKLRRRFVGLDVSREYLTEHAVKRLRVTRMMPEFAEI